MRKISWKFLIFILIIFIVSGFIIDKVRAKNNEKNIIQERKIKIAVCPTYYKVADFLDKTEYEIIKTNSSSESLLLLNKGQVNYVLSGRPLKPSEGIFQKEFISKDGYSFISISEKVVNKEDLINEIICTDLDKDQIEKDFNLKNVKKIDNINDCPDNGIIITSWDKTDYNQTNIVHVINSDGSRHTLSRTPILYCYENCLQNVTNKLKKIYEK